MFVKNTRKTTLLLFAILIVLGFATYIWLNRYDGIEIIEQLREKYGFLLMVIIVPIQIILSVTPFPSETIAFTGSVLLGFYMGSLSNWISWVIAAFIEYNLAKLGKKEFQSTDKAERFPSWLKKFPATSPIFLILGLWLPFGSHIVSISAGVYQVSVQRFMICIAIGYIPLSIFMSGLANGIINLATLWN